MHFVTSHSGSAAQINGRWWIRTTESVANRFTVCPLWPLGKPPIQKYYILPRTIMQRYCHTRVPKVTDTFGTTYYL